MNGLSKIKSDADVYKLYRGANRDLWVAAYDQLRFMPEVAELSSDKTMLELARKAGIKMPVFAARPILRADMPSDEKWEFPAHQDYPYNLGSLNCITIWIPFQDTPLELGALDVIPGSHLKGYVPAKKGLIIKPETKKFVTMPVKLGQALVFSQFLHHRSGHNRSEQVRFSLQVRFNDLASREYAKRKYYVNQKVSEKTLEPKFKTKFPGVKSV